jgi:hypothetical protein
MLTGIVRGVTTSVEEQ